MSQIQNTSIQSGQSCCAYILLNHEVFALSASIVVTTVTCWILRHGTHNNISQKQKHIHFDTSQKHDMETFKPISCSRICSNVLIVLENECLFALRSSCPQTLKLHSSCQITWQFVILIFDPLSLPRQSRRIWHPGKKKRKKRKKEDSSIAFHFAASADCTQETQR